MKDKIKTNLRSVIDALNTIEVRGKVNLLNLAGCISVLEQAEAQLEQMRESGEEKEE